MLTVTKRFTFEACHHLPYYEGACHRLHGHSYKLNVTVTGDRITDENNPKCGMIIDFKDLKKIVNKEVIDKYDHTDLNTFFENPTAENMVLAMAYDIEHNLPEGIKLVSVKLWETEDSYAEYTALGGMSV
jgi:6-pyruvoyltetrahydropterin/6-carboxytetrahydropterin synthase